MLLKCLYLCHISDSQNDTLSLMACHMREKTHNILQVKPLIHQHYAFRETSCVDVHYNNNDVNTPQEGKHIWGLSSFF